MCALTGDTSIEEFPLNSWFCKKDNDKMKKLYEKIHKAIKKDKQIVTVVLDGTVRDKALKEDVPYFVKDIYSTRYEYIIKLIDHSTVPNAEIRKKIKTVGEAYNMMAGIKVQELWIEILVKFTGV